MELRDQQVSHLYQALQKYVPAEMVNYDNNRLREALQGISLGEYKYLWSVVLNKRHEAVKEKLTYLGIETL